MEREVAVLLARQESKRWVRHVGRWHLLCQIFQPSRRKGVWLNSTAFTPLYKPLVWKVGQSDRPNPEGTLYCGQSWHPC